MAREWLRTDANEAEFWWFLADILRTQTKYAEAVVAARKAVDLKPNVSFQPRLANCLAKAGELQAAQQVYDEMLQRYPERGRYWFWYSQFLMDHHPDRVDEARQALETARTAADPNWRRSRRGREEAARPDRRGGTASGNASPRCQRSAFE